MRTRVALLACLFSLSPALAQAAGIVTVTETSDANLGGLSDQVINIAECNGTVSTDTLRLAWTYGVTPAAGNFYRLFAQTSSTCDLTAAGKVELTNTSGEATGGLATGSWPNSINVRTELIEPLGLASSCSASGATIYFCVVVIDSASSQTIKTDSNAIGSILVDTTKPTKPTSVSAEVGDGALNVHWAAGTGGATTSSWVITAAPVAPDATHTNCVAGGAAGAKECSGSTTTACRVTGLTNNACYDITVQALSAIDNPSVVSDAIPATPRPVQDFWERYQADGGQETGGCGAGGASLLSLLALAFLAPRLLRRRS